jgi:hypothetical protein
MIDLNRVTYGDLIYPDDRDGLDKHPNCLPNRSYEIVHRIQTRTRQINGCAIADEDCRQPGQLLEGFVDITDRKMAKQIERQVRRFQALRAIDNAISAGTDLQFTFGILLEQIMSQLNADAAAILLQNQVPGTE